MRLVNNKEVGIILDIAGKITHWAQGQVIEVDESLGQELLSEGYVEEGQE